MYINPVVLHQSRKTAANVVKLLILMMGQAFFFFFVNTKTDFQQLKHNASSVKELFPFILTKESKNQSHSDTVGKIYTLLVRGPRVPVSDCATKRQDTC